MRCEGILFDMDGVLVDVSRSYRMAIKKTAEFYLGEEIDPSEIQQFKNRGNYNNDWDLTEAILLDHEIGVKKEEIIERFQMVYLGNHFNGLVGNETWLLDANILQDLKKDYRLGIVTGRPRREALYALHRFGFSDAFGVLIALEDTPMGKEKPDPHGIEKAMETLRIKRAVYLGDTIDDMEAAVAAGVTPIGIVPESDSQEVQRECLMQHGASEILTNVNQILGFLR